MQSPNTQSLPTCVRPFVGQHILKVAECPICLSPFNFYTKHRPTSLPCGHTVCLDCVSKLKNVCANCRMGFQTSAPNFLWNDLSEALLSIASQVRLCAAYQYISNLMAFLVAWYLMRSQSSLLQLPLNRTPLLKEQLCEYKKLLQN